MSSRFFATSLAMCVKVATAILLVLYVISLFLTINSLKPTAIKVNLNRYTRWPRPQKSIVLWTQFFWQNYSNFDFEKLNCEVSDCRATYDKNLISTADAVLFHLYDVDLKDIPKDKANGQKWVLLNHEPPQNLGPKENLRQLGHRIDWTMTYRRDSDVFLPYGGVTPFENVSYVPEVQFRHRKKGVAWFVSHCSTSSKREFIAAELRRYIAVDTFGTCGSRVCPKSERTKCYEKISREYKFYLSFENALCKDYVTEKLFNILSYDVIPVVYGAADYKAIMPPNSYIDVNDFETVKQLAEHMKSVASDEKLFNSYLEWKAHYKPIKVLTACELCKALHSDLKPRPGRDLDKWFKKDANCVVP